MPKTKSFFIIFLIATIFSICHCEKRSDTAIQPLSSRSSTTCAEPRSNLKDPGSSAGMTRLDNKKNKTYHFLHFGTTIQVTLSPEENNLTPDTIKQIDNLLETLHYKWHPWREGNLKTLNNKLATLKPFETSEENIKIIKLSQDLYTQSQGYFNPAIGRLVNLWGFHSDNPNDQLFGTTESSNKQKSHNLEKILKKLPTPDDIKIQNNTVTNTNPYLQLDISGFIKADASLQIKQILLDHNIHHALINIGGDIYAVGYKHHKNKQPWIVAVKTKDNNYIKLKLTTNQAIATSGTYARQYQELNTKSVNHHIINPKTGEPSQGFYSATVIHTNPYIADAAATALLIAKDDYQKIAKAMGVEKYILLDNTNKIISENIKDNIID